MINHHSPSPELRVSDYTRDELTQRRKDNDPKKRELGWSPYRYSRQLMGAGLLAHGVAIKAAGWVSLVRALDPEVVTGPATGLWSVFLLVAGFAFIGGGLYHTIEAWNQALDHRKWYG